MRAINQHPSGPTGGVPQHLSSGGIGRRGSDATNLHGSAVGPARVPVNPREIDRVPWRRGRNRIRRGKLSPHPIVLVPRVPSNPLSRLAILRRLADNPGNFFDRFGPSKIQRLQAVAQRLHMSVRIDKSRDNRVAVSVNSTRRRANKLRNIVHGEDFSAFYRDRGRRGMRRIHRIYARARDGEIGRLAKRRHREQR